MSTTHKGVRSIVRLCLGGAEGSDEDGAAVEPREESSRAWRSVVRKATLDEQL